MTNEERLALARNKLSRLEVLRRLAWDAGEEEEVCMIDAEIVSTLERIAELEASQ
jgi:hypothetical protein